MSSADPEHREEDDAPAAGDDEDTGAQVAPIVKLEEVAVTTGVEEEDAILDLKSKLYQFDKDGNQWKERGVGSVKLLKHKTTGKVRLFMSQSKTLKICANHLILPNMTVQEHAGSKKSCIWHALDFSDGELKDELLCIRFASIEILPNMIVQEHVGSEKSCGWHVRDFFDGELKDELLFIRFASIESKYKLHFADNILSTHSLTPSLNLRRPHFPMDKSQLNYASARKCRCDENVAVFTPPPPVHQTTVKSVSSPDLPYDVIFQILPRLRVKSLLRFKCICKSLETLISDPKFPKQHLSHSNRQVVVPSIITKFANKTFTETHQYRVLGSCNGLLCIYNMSEGYVRLFNPSTRLRSKISPKIVVGIIISSGFGYDHVNDKYKVLISARYFIKIVTQIYTFGEKSWKTIKHFPYIPFRRSLSATFVSGTLNWLIRRYNGIANQFMILSFDLEKETYGELLLPEHDGYENCQPAMDVDVLTKCLRVCLKYNKTHWAMWRLNEYGNVESWTKLTIIPEDQKFWQRNWRPFMDQFCTSNKGSGGVVNLDSEMVLYDSISDDTGFHYPKIWRDWQCYYPYTYEESLVSPP